MIMGRYFNINYSLAAHLGRADVSEWRAERGQAEIPEASDADGLMLTLCLHYLLL